MPRFLGVSRLADNDKALLVSFAERLTDDQLRDLHDFLSGPRRGVEAGWVIERGDSETCEPKYWAGSDRDPTRSSAWTSNHMEAIRFARRDDAEKVAKRALGGIDVRICEHEWA